MNTATKTATTENNTSTAVNGWVTITRRSRNLGLGSTSEVEQTDRGLKVKRVTAPSVTGSLKAVAAEAARVASQHGGRSYNLRLFVGGVPVCGGTRAALDALAELEVSDSVRVCVDPATWAAFCESLSA